MNETVLWYTRPASTWTEALPLGNGALGAMVYGGICRERVALNVDTLWSGAPKQWNNPEALSRLAEVRRRVSEARFVEATEASRAMMGPFNESYLPLGEMEVVFEHGEFAEEYRRELDLARAAAVVSYRLGKASFRREAFVSFPDRVLAMRFTATGAGRLAFTARLTSPLRHSLGADGKGLTITGRAPSYCAPSYWDVSEPIVYEEGKGMRFACVAAATARKGSVAVDPSGIHVRDAEEAVILLAAATSYRGYDAPPDDGTVDPRVSASQSLAEAGRRSFDELRQRHQADHARLFDRVSFHLRGDDDDMATDELIARRGAASSRLIELLFHYGRYLLIASSRPGTQPANLQGIWNDQVRPPWSSNWTININTEMNYWPAESCNLSECHEPLISMIRDLSVNGRETARINYGCRGWTAHHNVDLWRQSAPVGDWGGGDPVWAIWPMGGVWLCMHLWEHFAFTGDKEYLRATAYPVMKGAAEFCLDWLFDDGEGHLVTCPSTSPEHKFRLPDGSVAAVSAATTADMTLIRELFTSCIEAAQALGLDEEFRTKVQEARARLLPFRIGRRGRLQEWSVDFDDGEEHHRHASHLIGVHPGRQITSRATPELFAAARTSLEIRGDTGTGWSLAWKINQWARLAEGDRARRLLANLLAPTQARDVRLEGGGVYPNLFDAHPPFQIDGNFGATAGIAEMLLQSHEGFLNLLPALPAAWPAGEFGGLCARGGFEVDARWEDGSLRSAVVRAKIGGRLHLRYRDNTAEIDTTPGGTYSFGVNLSRL